MLCGGFGLLTDTSFEISGKMPPLGGLPFRLFLGQYLFGLHIVHY